MRAHKAEVAVGRPRAAEEEPALAAAQAPGAAPQAVAVERPVEEAEEAAAAPTLAAGRQVVVAALPVAVELEAAALRLRPSPRLALCQPRPS